MNAPPSTSTTPSVGHQVGEIVDEAGNQAEVAGKKIEEVAGDAVEDANKALEPPKPTFGERVEEYFDETGKKLAGYAEGVSNTFTPNEPTLGDKVADVVDGKTTD